ncbi:unnamed protein product [Brachionus calyciflorus]|uniref:Methyltransferase FkbM domain-containing protein n=1 Tax=Brachionus calyciflorus TaxID=104777 RepID=A0A814H189_9BILA|nr:unnamed protein product [Brachionus calyciflorus]
MNNFFKNYLIIISFILVLLVFHRKFNGSSESDSSYVNDGLNRIDFSDMLTTKDVYDSIKCRQSIKIIVQTTICVHDLTDDQHVSGAIWNHGIWEGPIMQKYMDLISNNPDWLIFDIGAQVGQYSLFSAQLGRNVIAVEPFFDNVLRINKAVRTEGFGHRITLIRNAVSNKKNEIKRLFPYKGDLGGQTLLNHKKEIYTREDMQKDKYLVETILFDDLIEFLPNQPNGSPYKKGILKIDIEGFEPYAFESAHKMFNLIDFQVIFMEWVHLPRHADLADLVEKMIDLFTKHKLVAYDGGNKLDRNNWRQWPQDVVWLKEQ